MSFVLYTIVKHMSTKHQNYFNIFQQKSRCHCFKSKILSRISKVFMLEDFASIYLCKTHQ
jgi:hypothetical protein